jgi:hypothetical protein
MTKLRIVCATAALAATASGTALAETTANIGFMSDYIFRGAYQAESVAFGGIDVETDSGFYIGTWGANVKDGLEYDLYLGYGGGGEEFTWYAGVTGYYYTDDFDNSYEELNLGFSYGFMSIDYALGRYKYPVSSFQPPAINPELTDEWHELWEDTQTYEYVGATFAPENGPYYFIGRTDYHNIAVQDNWPRGRAYNTGKSGYWFEIGKTFEIMEDLEINVAGLYSGDVRQEQPPSKRSSVILNANDVTSEFAVTVTLTKTIHLNN